MFYYVLFQIVLLLLLLLLLSACPKAGHLVDETTVKGKGLLLQYRANVHCNILCTCNVHCLFTFTDRHIKCNAQVHCNILHMCKCSRTASTCARAHFCPDPSVGANLSCFALPRFIALMNCTCTLDPPTQLNVNIQVQQQDNLRLTPNNEKIVHPLKMFMIL